MTLQCIDFFNRNVLIRQQHCVRGHLKFRKVFNFLENVRLRIQNLELKLSHLGEFRDTVELPYLLLGNLRMHGRK